MTFIYHTTALHRLARHDTESRFAFSSNFQEPVRLVATFKFAAASGCLLRIQALKQASCEHTETIV